MHARIQLRGLHPLIRRSHLRHPVCSRTEWPRYPCSLQPLIPPGHHHHRHPALSQRSALRAIRRTPHFRPHWRLHQWHLHLDFHRAVSRGNLRARCTLDPQGLVVFFRYFYQDDRKDFRESTQKHDKTIWSFLLHMPKISCFGLCNYYAVVLALCNNWRTGLLKLY